MSNETVELSAEQKAELERLERISRNQLKTLEAYRANCDRLIAWVKANRERLDGTHYDACHISCTMEIRVRPWEDGFERDARAIARRWPGRVWKRVPTENACGSCDYLSEPEGDVPIRITPAEKMEWKVKLDAPLEV